MSDSEVNRLKTGAFTFGFETFPPSSCLCHLTLLVSHLSLHHKLNLICDVEVCAGLFVHISDERQIVRLTNKSLVCTK